MTSRSAAPIGSRELARRQREARAWVGRQILEARTEAGLQRRALARCVGVDESYLWRIEAGRARASLEVLVAVAGCLGSELGVRLFPTSGPRLVDRFQAPMLEALIRRLDRRWRGTLEVPVPRARGVIDLVLDRRDGRLAVACECHSEVRRLELVLRRASEKAEALRELRPGADVSQLLLLRSTRANRAAAVAFAATLSTAYPGLAHDARAALTGTAAWPGAAIVWVRLESDRAVLLNRPPRGVALGR